MADKTNRKKVTVDLQKHPQLKHKLSEIESALKVPAQAVAVECLRLRLGQKSKTRKK